MFLRPIARPDDGKSVVYARSKTGKQDSGVPGVVAEEVHGDKRLLQVGVAFIENEANEGSKANHDSSNHGR